MTNIISSGLPNNIPTRDHADWPVAKDYFMYRRSLDRAIRDRCYHYHNPDDDGTWCNVHNKPDREFVFMPLRVNGKNHQVSNTSILPGLPAELILDIADRLAPIDLLSFRTTCKYMRSLTCTRDARSRLLQLRAEDIDEHAWQQRKDCFKRMAEYEDSNNALYRYTPRGKLLCSYCMDLHPASDFDAVEPSARSTGNTHRRRCTASTAKVYLCPHIQLGFDDLHQLHRGPANSLVCTICIASCTSGAKSTASRDYCSLSQRMFLPLGSNRYMWPTPGCLPIRGGTLHCNSFSDKSRILSTLRKVIQNADMYVCPHVSSKEKVCEMLGSMIEDALFRRRKRKHSFYDSAPYQASQFSGCAKPGCVAGVVVRLEEAGITIETSREVKITTVRSENWIVSTQPPVVDARK